MKGELSTNLNLSYNGKGLTASSVLCGGRGNGRAKR
jgi:hypothetical protein